MFYSFRQKDDIDSSQRTRIVVQKSHSFRWRHLLCAWPFHFVAALALTALLCVLLVFSHPGSLASHYEEVYLPDPSPGLVTNMILCELLGCISINQGVRERGRAGESRAPKFREQLTTSEFLNNNCAIKVSNSCS